MALVRIKTCLVVNLMAILDYFSTYVAFELSRNNQVTEVGLLAKWVLQTGGFLELFLVENDRYGCAYIIGYGSTITLYQIGIPRIWPHRICLSTYTICPNHRGCCF